MQPVAPPRALARTVGRSLARALPAACVLALLPGPGLAPAADGPEGLLAVLAASAQEAPVGTAAHRDDPGRSDAAHATSTYLPLGHWAYPVLERWISAGVVERLSPFTRPWRRADVARAIGRLEPGDLDGAGAAWLARLRSELARELDLLAGRREAAAQLRTGGRVGAGWTSQDHPDPLRAELEGDFASDRLLERLVFVGEGEIGPVAGAFRAGRDGAFLHDARFPDGRAVEERRLWPFDEGAIRIDDAYVEVQSEHASLFFGRMDRNWGPPGLSGLTRSAEAYSHDELGYRIGTDRFFLSGTLSAPRDVPGDTTRYLSTHRLEARPWTNFMVAVTEAVIHGGPSEPMNPTLVNPVGVWHLAQHDRETPRNAVGQLDLWWRPTGGLTLFGSLLADATNSPQGSDTSCCQMGGSLGLELPRLAPDWIVRASGTALQSMVYRTVQPWEEWSVHGIGLGWDKADLYLLTLEADWLGRPGLVLTPRLDVQVQGEGDFHDRLRIPAEELPDVERILIGREETTVRTALAGRWHAGRADDWALDVEWDLGVSFIRDFEHRAGDDRTAFVGRVRFTLDTPRLLMDLD